MRTQNHFESGFESPLRKVPKHFAFFLFDLILTFQSVDLNPDSNQLCALIMYTKKELSRSAIIFWVSWWKNLSFWKSIACNSFLENWNFWIWLPHRTLHVDWLTFCRQYEFENILWYSLWFSYFFNLGQLLNSWFLCGDEKKVYQKIKVFCCKNRPFLTFFCWFCILIICSNKHFNCCNALDLWKLQKPVKKFSASNIVLLTLDCLNKLFE
jgi:hypothetical protein